MIRKFEAPRFARGDRVVAIPASNTAIVFTVTQVRYLEHNVPDKRWAYKAGTYPETGNERWINECFLSMVTDEL